MRVKDCMTKQVISVGAGEPVSVAARLMARYNLGALPVRGTDGQLEGMLTDRDIVLRCIAAERSPKAVRMREVMTRSVAAAAGDGGGEARRDGEPCRSFPQAGLHDGGCGGA